MLLNVLEKLTDTYIKLSKILSFGLSSNISEINSNLSVLRGRI